jgi:phage FluMu protein Com
MSDQRQNSERHSHYLGVSVADRTFEIPGGLPCQHCGQLLTRVNHTRTTPGFILRERHCPSCGRVNTTSERIVAVRERHGKFSDPAQ